MVICNWMNSFGNGMVLKWGLFLVWVARVLIIITTFY